MRDSSCQTDRCPGLLRPFLADDGAIIRLRKPGGRIATNVLVSLTEAVTRFGAPGLHVTSRGNIEARRLPTPVPGPLADDIIALGLLPTQTHERVRNIFANPRNPRLAPLVSALDEAICADPALVELPGRFWFGFTDESALGMSEPFDVAYQLLSDTSGRVITAGKAMDVPPANAVDAMIATAHAFLDTRPGVDVWNVRDLPADSPLFAKTYPVEVTPASPLVPGVIGADLVIGIPLGDLSLDQARALETVADEVVVTPWRSLVVPGAAQAAADLARAGFVTDSTSAWGRVSACAGAPYCRRTSKRTSEIAAALVTRIPSHGPHVHLAGCDRHCGASENEHIIYPDTIDEALAQLSS